MKQIVLAGVMILFAQCFCIAQTWSRVTAIPKEESIYCLSVFDHTVYAGGGRTVYIGSNDGSQWRASSHMDDDLIVLAVAKFHQKLYAGTFRDGIRVSDDDGMSWRPLNLGLGVYSISSLAIWKDELYAGTYGVGFYKLDEAAGSWTPFNSNFFTNVDGNVYQLMAIDSTLTAAAGLNGISYRWDPNSNSWDYTYYLSRLAPGLAVVSLLFDSAKVLYAGSTSRLGLLRSEDRGRSWVADNNGVQPGDPFLAADDQFDFAAVNYLDNSGGNSVKLYQRSLHASVGTTWDMTDSFPNSYLYTLGVAGGLLYSGRDSGLYYKATGVTVIPDSIDKPFVYPNPASGRVNIGLHFAEPQIIGLHIYDAMGKLVSTPLKNYMLAAGSQVITVDLAGLAKGVYIIDVSTSQRRNSTRLIVR
jgi:hypothetical protein